MSEATEKASRPEGAPSLTTEQRRRFEEVRRKWDDKFKDLAEGIEQAGRITEDDLAIRIVSRD